ncbi:MAG: hypothetical protein AVDCRST_MAG48-2180 [uncultured Friedmanniella sp.]|uniref:Uncharacterized protein n=1 Tax=uncultured Friedmanniella sp. TaxID=335381 RepID=A0A6J4KSF3_9ACTN|nr:MAG: hypothetical protein AVDCRST_MAG48-2180 [uncultured Friedmanniella sp.]
MGAGSDPGAAGSSGPAALCRADRSATAVPWYGDARRPTVVRRTRAERLPEQSNALRDAGWTWRQHGDMEGLDHLCGPWAPGLGRPDCQGRRVPTTRST